MAETISGTHCTYPQRDGQAELAWINTGMVDPPKDASVTNPSTNRARRSIVCDVVEKNTTRRREGAGVVVEKNEESR